MPIDFEKISSQFIDDLDKLQEDFIKRIEQALKGDLSAAGIARLDAEIDFFQELRVLGFDDKLEEYLKGYDDVIREIHASATKRGLSGIVGVTATDLEILADNEALFLLDKGRLYTQQFKNSVFRGIIGGETIGEILPSLRGIPLTDAQLTTGVTTGITRFHATATAKVFEESPDQKFVIAGPIDGKTRASCRAVLLNQPKKGFTKAEIDEGAWTRLAKQFMGGFQATPSEIKVVNNQGYTFIERGGFNCRHQPQPKGLEL